MRSIRGFISTVMFVSILISAASCRKENSVTITSGDLLIEFNSDMFSKITSTATGAKDLMNEFSASEYISGNRFIANEFSLTDYKIIDEVGDKKKHIISGISEHNGIRLQKTIRISVDSQFPGMVLMDVQYVNIGNRSVKLDKWVNNSYDIVSIQNEPEFWSFQASSSNRRLDWIVPVTPGFYKENFMGMNSSDYGGGIPAIDLWRKDAGIMVGHVELVPKLVSLPVEMDPFEKSARMGVHFNYTDPFDFMPGDTINTYTTFVSVHQGDYFSSLRQYSEMMQNRGLEFVPSQPEAFEAVWCAWGYGRDFKMSEVTGTLPKVKELGIKWVDVDDGFQIAEGDWDVDVNRFPGGNQEMKNLVRIIHSYGMKAKLWWAPLAVDPGTKLLNENPNILLIRRDGSPQYITYWNSYYMSPTYVGTRNHTKEIINMFINEWGFDGLKMDGQHLNSVAPNYNRRQRHAYPEEDVERLPEFFQMIYDETTALKPDAVIQNCPCGCAISMYNIASMNQAVASDPTSSYQIRHKGKTYKSINPGLAYYGDHVELSDNKDDFGTQFGIGSVLGTKFTWPENPDRPNPNFLTPEKEVEWKKWFGLYNSKMLSREKYLGELYDIGYDKPETHVIQKGDTLFYAFYAENWDGPIEFRGLAQAEYVVRDYINEVEIGKVSSDKPVLNATFRRNLLVELFPVK